MTWKYRNFHFFSLIIKELQKCVSKSLNPNLLVVADFSLRFVATYEVAATIWIPLIGAIHPSGFHPRKLPQGRSPDGTAKLFYG